MNTHTIDQTSSLSLTERMLPAAFAAIFGVFILMGVGFAQVDAVHNAAHDGRHSLAFPCH